MLPVCKASVSLGVHVLRKSDSAAAITYDAWDYIVMLQTH